MIKTIVGAIAALLVGAGLGLIAVRGGQTLQYTEDHTRPVSVVVGTLCGTVIGAVIVDTYGVVHPIGSPEEFKAALPLFNALPNSHIIEMKAPCVSAGGNGT